MLPLYYYYNKILETTNYKEKRLIQLTILEIQSPVTWARLGKDCPLTASVPHGAEDKVKVHVGDKQVIPSQTGAQSDWSPTVPLKGLSPMT